MKRLRRSDKVNTAVRQCRMLGGTVDRFEIRTEFQLSFRRESHIRIRFDGFDFHPGFQKFPCENACPGADIRDCGGGVQRIFMIQMYKKFRRIPRTVFRVNIRLACEFLCVFH